MKSVVALLAALLATAHAFSSSSSFTGSPSVTMGAATNGNTLSMEYIPSGMTKEQWRKVKEEERKKTAGKNLGTVGITSFKSRSFADWQKSGGKNLFPVDPRTVKNKKDIPYMQRPGGSPDDDDLKKSTPFSLFGKKKAPAPEPEKPKTTNWWTL